ncbi:helix-turn-helix domain-containing protein [Avibacterium endocarditidis]|uniref:Transcriptional regulator n=1 Tax=Avibacterium endocarditidis TaxID=380674 RepID=A0ABX4ZT05_9PAST|nr:helix-turn-helix transcriptional regulator [Avibacterium endocarditidis]POY42090.1 transcriptional regulator [Avibacterium endocarditidis]
MYIGHRLKEERQRMGLTQRAFAKLGGVRSQAQFKYEHNRIMPRADYLMKLGLEGVDINYILFGERGVIAINKEEKCLLDLLRNSKDIRDFILHGVNYFKSIEI